MADGHSDSSGSTPPAGPKCTDVRTPERIPPGQEQDKRHLPCSASPFRLPQDPSVRRWQGYICQRSLGKKDCISSQHTALVWEALDEVSKGFKVKKAYLQMSEWN